MTIEEIAKRVSAHMYSNFKESERPYSYEDYWERNKQYFLAQARTYLQMNGYLQGQDLADAAYIPKKEPE